VASFNTATTSTTGASSGVKDWWLYVATAIKLSALHLLLLYGGNFTFIFHLHLTNIYYLIDRTRLNWGKIQLFVRFAFISVQ